MPIEHEAGRRRFERHRWSSDLGPNIPEFQRRLQVGVLNRFAVTCQTTPYVICGTVKTKRNESRMAQQFFDRRVKRTKHERIARMQRRRQWPIFRAHVKVAFTKNNRAESLDVLRIQ